ncbi:protein PRQFV-amide [Hyalella azteca]|uniref:Protein PRQFV-amide n=1 Tax=Hyalella azteca TaxID=294128 RepID=A0A8B7NZD5_HYAAZ|nr:protein PRQFV-amide [Hyalella azteca]
MWQAWYARSETKPVPQAKATRVHQKVRSASHFFSADSGRLKTSQGRGDQRGLRSAPAVGPSMKRPSSLCLVAALIWTLLLAPHAASSSQLEAVEFQPAYSAAPRYLGSSEEYYQDGGAADWSRESNEISATGLPLEKKWTGPEERSQARMLYNYLLSRRFGGDLFGKRMGSSYPGNKFRFFTNDPSSSGSGVHGSEFLGKRNTPGNIGISEFLGKRARVSEFLGKRAEEGYKEKEEIGTPSKRARISEFLGKRGRISEFLGKRARVSEFLGKRLPSEASSKRTRASEYSGKWPRVSEFLGKRSVPDPMPMKKARVSEFLGKRASPSELYGKRASISEYWGKRLINPYDFSTKRVRASEFLGKRSRSRVSEFLGKRSVDDEDPTTINDKLVSEEEPLAGGASDESSKLSHLSYV